MCEIGELSELSLLLHQFLACFLSCRFIVKSLGQEFGFWYRRREGRGPAPARLAAALVDCTPRYELFECGFYAAAAEMAVEVERGICRQI
jgi:hypothetical protein